MKVYEAIATAIHDSGVRDLFGLMVDANMLVVTEFQSRQGSRFIPFLGEGASVSAADGYARFGRQASVATVTHGPGATNALTALTEAVRARIPLVLLTGDTPAANPTQGQNISLAKIAGAVEARPAILMAHE